MCVCDWSVQVSGLTGSNDMLMLLPSSRRKKCASLRISHYSIVSSAAQAQGESHRQEYIQVSKVSLSHSLGLSFFLPFLLLLGDSLQLGQEVSRRNVKRHFV